MDKATLRRLRGEWKISQRKMAGLFGVSLRTLQGWESGRPMPDSAKRMLVMALAFFRVETKTQEKNT